MKKFARTVRGLVHGLDASKCSKSAVINSSYSVNKHMVSLESSIGTRVQILDELVNYWGSRFFEVQTDTNKRYYIHESFLEVEPEPKKYAYTVPGARIQCIDASKCSKLQLRDGSMPLSETLTWLAGDMRVEVLDKFTSKLGTNGLYFEIKTDDDRRCYVHDSLIALVRGDWSYFKGVKGAGWGWACKCPGPIIRMDGCLRCERCNVERPLGSPPCSQPTEPTEQEIRSDVPPSPASLFSSTALVVGNRRGI